MMTAAVLSEYASAYQAKLCPCEIRLLKAHGDTACVKTVFITDPQVDLSALTALAHKAKQITEAVQHTLEMNSLDCASCKMKPICDEVDGLRALHFKKEEERKSHGT